MRTRRLRTVLPGLVVLAIVLLLVGAASAAPSGERRVIPLKLGGSQVIAIERPSYEMKIITSDDDIVHARALRENKIYVRGKKLGYCTVTVWDERNRDLLAEFDVTVTLDLTGLKQKLHELYPEQEIQVYASETGVVLTGTVSGPEIVDQVLRLTRTFLPRLAEGPGTAEAGTGRSGAGITNLLTVQGLQQILLEVKVAEVTRHWDREIQAGLGLGKLGKDFTGSIGLGNVFSPLAPVGGFPGVLPGGTVANVIDATVNGVVQNPGSLLLNIAGNAPNLFLNIDNFSAALRFLEVEGLARTLAEPRLVTLSGQEASFLAGGEFPIPVPQDNDSITIEFREFGVGLRFTPVVMSGGKISLRVAPSVSEIAGSSRIPAGIEGAEFVVPNLATRKLETTVQLYDGQTLALAGLLQENIRENLRKVPGLGDLPVLGALFRSTTFQQEKTDLLIAVTPRLVKASPAGSLHFPGENFRAPNRYELYLEGRLEGRRPAADAGGNQEPPPVAVQDGRGGLEGSFGYEPVSAAH